jgi:sulfide:quinone oxidoreductase
MATEVLILGGGTGGTLLANRLRRRLAPREVSITVVDSDDRHVYQPGLLFVPFGLAEPHELTRSRQAQLHDHIHFGETSVERIDLEADTAHFADGTALHYDVLVVATGARLVPEETEGLAEALGADPSPVHTFYELDHAARLAAALERFEGGRLVVNVVDLPVKCPVAPLEFAFLADWYFTERRIRERVEIVYVTPLDAAFTKPVAARTLGGLLEEKHIELVTEFNTGAVELGEPGGGGRLVSYDERDVPFDLAVVVPLHSGAAFVERSAGLGDELGYVPVNPNTLQSAAKANVFAIGDAAGVPTSKAGSVTHFEGEVLAENICRYLDGRPLDASFDGHTNCFIETGFDKALLIDFTYDTEPLPGHFPGPGPFGLPLMKQSRTNHLGKLMFQWFYWHTLLKGRSLPGLSAGHHAAGNTAAGEHEQQHDDEEER